MLICQTVTTTESRMSREREQERGRINYGDMNCVYNCLAFTFTAMCTLEHIPYFGIYKLAKFVK